MTGWVWFRARDLDHALSFFASLAGLHGVSTVSMATHLVLHPATVAAMLLGAVLATVEIDIWRATRRALGRVALPAYALGDTAAIALFFALSVLSVAAGSYSPFLYFRFLLPPPSCIRTPPTSLDGSRSLGDRQVLAGPVSQLPESERRVLAAERTASIVAVPIFLADGWWGYLGADDCGRGRVWSPGRSSCCR